MSRHLGGFFMTRKHIFMLTSTAVLIAIGILIPMVFPRVVIGPASYTLASHVAIFVAMFISPAVAVAVTLGTTIGFFIGGFPIIIVLRAASHIIFAFLFSAYIKRANPQALKGLKLRALSASIAIIHAIAEVAVVIIFFFSGMLPEDQGFWWVVGFIGLGTIFHSLLDFELANAVRRGLSRAGIKMIK